MKKIVNKTLVLSFLCLFITIGAYGQGREYIRQQIKEKGECRNVAITKTNGDLMLYGRNGCSRSVCPSHFNDAIKILHNDREFIDYI